MQMKRARGPARVAAPSLRFTDEGRHRLRIEGRREPSRSHRNGRPPLQLRGRGRDEGVTVLGHAVPATKKETC